MPFVFSCYRLVQRLMLLSHLISLLVEMALQLLLAVGMALMVSGTVYDEFKQWDPIHWVVKSTNRVELPCYHPRHFPFNNLSSMQNVQWILPEHTSYMHLKPGDKSEGWEVLNMSQKYKLIIEKEKMNKPETVDGMYLCAALAEILPQVGKNKTYAWFYLRWGVGLYSNVPANIEGSIAQKQIDHPNHHKMVFQFHLLLATAMAVLVSADIHDEFPQWDRIHWVVRSTDTITLNCTHPIHYPFNNIQQALSVQWILPKATSYRHLNAGQNEEGWQVTPKDRDYQLKINKGIMNVPESVNGMYVCAALAPVQGRGANTYAWYYLRWGVGLYTNVPAMNEGTTGQKYYWPFTYAWVSVLVGLVIIALFSLTMHFKYKGGPTKDEEDEEEEEDESSLEDDEKVSTKGKKDRSLEIDEYGTAGRL
ncbi:unnamed protein product [Taenia asiatica]|uniref:Ig-like domain-containing protein n=1 Tax=Taenia asiatica TaxID=60517 RepID=A0A3P6QCF0_TAEAS|nr:unnamed protein product [Taenia asiatica]